MKNDKILLKLACTILIGAMIGIAIGVIKESQKKQTGMIQTIYYPDGSIESIANDSTVIFRQDTAGNIGLGTTTEYNIDSTRKIRIFKNGDMLSTYGWEANIPTEMIITSDNIIHIEKERSIGNSTPMERLIIKQDTANYIPADYISSWRLLESRNTGIWTLEPTHMITISGTNNKKLNFDFKGIYSMV